MPDREPEPWESGAAAPFPWIETARGNVEVWALGEDRFGARAIAASRAEADPTLIHRQKGGEPVTD